MSKELVPYSDLQKASILADEVARQNVLERYLRKKSPETIRRQYWDIKTFASYLEAANINSTGIVLELPEWKEVKLNLEAWKDVTHGIVEGFVHWQLNQGFAIGSLNVRLSTIKTYCKLASLSGFLSQDELAKIKLVEGFRHKEGKNADENREIKRVGKKKAEAIILTKEQVRELKEQPNTPQGWRDRVIICFCLDHGLRCGELQGLKLANIDLLSGKLHFYRKKVNKDQTHELTKDTYHAVIRYLQFVKDLKPDDQLLQGSQKSKDGDKLAGGMSTRAITGRVNTLGKKIGIDNLSAHDWRHTWGTHAVEAETDIVSLMEAGGWSSPAMPLSRYVHPNQISNKGVKLNR